MNNKESDVLTDDVFDTAYVSCVLMRAEIQRIASSVGVVKIPVSLKDLTNRVQEQMKILKNWTESHGVAEGYLYNPRIKAFTKVKQAVPSEAQSRTKHVQ